MTIELHPNDLHVEHPASQDALDYALMVGRLQANHSFTAGQFKLFKQSLKHREVAVPLHVNGRGIDGVIGQVFRKVHEECDGNISKLSRRLKISRSTANVWASRFLSCVILLFALNASAQTNAVTLAWNRSVSTNELGYRIYLGDRTGHYTNSIDVGSNDTARLTGLIWRGTYYFAATAVDEFGEESTFSNEVRYAVPEPPQPRLNIAVERLKLDWIALGGVSYALQYKTNLSSTNWFTYSTFMSGTNATARYLVTNDAPNKLWRVKL